MAAKVWPRLLPSTLFFILSLIPLSISSELNSPQNVETFFPLQTSPVTPIPSIPKTSPASSPHSNSQTSSSSSTSATTIAKSVGITAACTLVLAGIFFFFLQKYTAGRHGPRLDKNTGSSRIVPLEQAPLPPDESNRYDGNLKESIVDENGLDVLYWRMLEDGHPDYSLSNNVLHEHNGEGEEEEEEEEEVDYHGGPPMISGPIQEIPLIGEKFSNSPSRIFPQGKGEDPQGRGGAAMAKAENSTSSKPVVLPTSASAPPPSPPPPANPAKKNPPPPPAPPITMKKGPPVPPLRAAAESSSGEKGSDQAKLKPLHWDKVTTNVHHSMVWHKINNGSFR